MNKYLFFLGKRINVRDSHDFSRAVSNIAVGSIAVSLAVLILANLTFSGFKQTIADKIYAHAGHIYVSKFTQDGLYTESSVRSDQQNYKSIQANQEVEAIYPIAYKAGLVRSNEATVGLLVKGVDLSQDTLLAFDHIVAGRGLRQPTEGAYASEIVLSTRQARELSVQIGQEVFLFFFQKPIRTRRVQVVGLYDTGIEDFDEQISYTDLNLIRKINAWDSVQAGGFEVFVQHPARIDSTARAIYEDIDFDHTVRTAGSRFAHFFDWFVMLDRNMLVFTITIVFVVFFNILSIILILIMERTSFIGTLKALGARNSQVQLVFVVTGLRLALKGMLLGNLLGISMALVQHHFKWVGLDYETYYMRAVPVKIDWLKIATLNAEMFFFILLFIYVPTYFISSIKPVEAIRFQ